MKKFNYSNLDPKIKKAVRLLRTAGFETMTSCQGGDGHAFKKPTIGITINHSRVNQIIEFLETQNIFDVKIKKRIGNPAWNEIYAKHTNGEYVLLESDSLIERFE